MKRVRSLAENPPLLDKYIVALGHPVGKGDYDIFRKNDRAADGELRSLLIKRQHGLCAYCEWRIGPDGNYKFPVQVEHYVTRESNPSRELDYTNFLGCCNGGADRQYVGRFKDSSDAALKAKWIYYCIEPIGENMRCGQAKDDRARRDAKTPILDPRQFPLTANGAMAQLVRVSRTTGAISADEDGCAEVGISAEHLNQTLTSLNLSSDGLCWKRKQIWSELESRFIPEETTLDEVRVQLLPDEDDNLHPFWSTIRCYFGGFAETVLDEAEAKEKLC